MVWFRMGLTSSARGTLKRDPVQNASKGTDMLQHLRWLLGVVVGVLELAAAFGLIA
jgi:hypothetical protein